MRPLTPAEHQWLKRLKHEPVLLDTLPLSLQMPKLVHFLYARGEVSFRPEDIALLYEAADMIAVESRKPDGVWECGTTKRLSSVAWPSAVAEALRIGNLVANSWELSGDGFSKARARATRTTVGGLVQAEWRLETRSEE